MAEVQFSKSPIRTILKPYREDTFVLSHDRVRPKWKGVNRRTGGKEHIRTNRDQAGEGSIKVGAVLFPAWKIRVSKEGKRHFLTPVRGRLIIRMDEKGVRHVLSTQTTLRNPPMSSLHNPSILVVAKCVLSETGLDPTISCSSGK
jgi:hypothetical protein